MPTIFQTGQRAHRLHHAFVEIQKLLAELGIAPEVRTTMMTDTNIWILQSLDDQAKEITVSLHIAIPHVTNLVSREHDSEGYVCLAVDLGGTEFKAFHYSRGFRVDSSDQWAKSWLKSKGLYRRKNLRQEEVVTFIRDFVAQA